ncbi:RmlC-like cupin domain-containing protein [Talaromyces proteolyticus]|uniref:RmlC-like cupin domain-containing protein n=1 Tax=Talaromyces proteolyticus TaxID=1131652 RepID=A0AAD4KCY1_9EURO|nr:RmlC-like cupin domain-containing protein [Talaromyces proteolyticus]KAH8688660.1 RmlC-like cupin domain-containing protein [Talaromyces proteolyticus]
MQPMILPANQPANRFYRGGAQITAFRSESTQPCGEYDPEDWVASTTCCYGQDTLGLTKLDNGRILVDEIQSHAEQWLGPDHVEAFGSSTRILVKLLDAGQRLPVHAHPHRDWAKRHLGTAYGKAELWYVLEPGVMRVGLRESITQERLRALVDAQDVETLVALMHEVPLKRHQAVYIPPGVLHAIGEGMLIAEVQEPSDLSVFCEWRDYAIDGSKDGHLGLGFDVALTAVETSGRTNEDIAALITDPDTEGPLASHHTGEYFTVERHNVVGSASPESFAPGFAIIIVFEGDNLQMTTTAGGSAALALRKGNTIVVPYGAGSFQLKGSGSVIIARPPRP